ncbi:acyltransferase family protein [Microbacterium sp. A84]|uniref:acyltransferase family protein n=1 Tax=Microbacterium sp. A84 TaxID=3450715 RepID=UPI003F4252B3
MTSTVGMTRREARELGLAAGTPSIPAASNGVKPPAKPYFAAIDGARGIAIASVLLYHTGWSSRGLFGVDAFFVISGFLITFLMVKELRRTGRLGFGAFYGRRAKRILPGVVVTLVAVLYITWQFGAVEELHSAADTTLFALAQVANWHQVGTGAAYWEQAGQIVPLGQMWSLAVTEQFYVVWPVLVLAFWFLSRRRVGALVVWLFVGLAASSLVAPLLFDGTNFDRLYLGTDVRVVSFAAGAAFAALIAWILEKSPRWATVHATIPARIIITTVSAIALIVVVAASIATESYHEPWLYQGGLAAISVAVAVFIASICLPGNAMGRFFAWKPFTVVGIMSYSLFLVHLPVYWLLTHLISTQFHPLVLFVVGGVLSFLVALVLHYVITEPIRKKKWKPGAALVAILASFAVVIALAWYLPIQRANAPASAAVAEQTDPRQVFSVDSTVTLPVADDGGPITVAVIGDSVAVDMYSALATYGGDAVSAIDVAKGGCGIFDADTARAGDGYLMDTKTDCWSWQDRLLAANAEHQPDVYILRNQWDVNDQLHGGEWLEPCTDAWTQRYRSQLELLVSIGNQLPTPPLILLANDRDTGDSGNTTSQRVACKDDVAASVADEYANVRLLDFKGATCPTGECLSVAQNGEEIYRDGTHFSEQGKALLAPWLEYQIALGSQDEQAGA